MHWREDGRVAVDAGCPDHAHGRAFLFCRQSLPALGVLCFFFPIHSPCWRCSLILGLQSCKSHRGVSYDVSNPLLL